MTPFEKVLLCHDRLSFVFLHCIRSAFVFATQPKMLAVAAHLLMHEEENYDPCKVSAGAVGR
jgi:hypothetical protein